MAPGSGDLCSAPAGNGVTAVVPLLRQGGSAGSDFFLTKPEMYATHVLNDGIDSPRLPAGRGEVYGWFGIVGEPQLEREFGAAGDFFTSLARNPLKSPDSGK